MPALDPSTRKTSQRPTPVASSQKVAAFKTKSQLSSFLAAIVESSDDAIYSCTLEGLITSWNKAAERIFGYKSSEILGKATSILSSQTAKDTPSILEQIRHGQLVDHYETTRLHKDGSEIIVSLSVSPIYDTAGNIIGASKVARDITSARQAEQSLRNADKLALAGRMAASIAHEINNPLEAITNLLYLLQQEDLSPQSREYLTLAQHELVRVSTIASQTLGFFRGTHGPAKTQLNEIIDSAISLHAGRLLLAEINVKTSYRPTPALFCQQGELRQVLVNLISNALDSMEPKGNLQIRIRPSTHPATGISGIRLTVADTGSGMSAQTLRLLFEPFYTTKGSSGTGLGLWVTQQIISRHKGRIAVRSSQHAAHHGTVFSIFFPLLDPHATQTASDSATTKTLPIDVAPSTSTSREDASRHTPSEPAPPSAAYSAA